MNDTQQLEHPTPESRFKQHIAFAQIIAEQQIAVRIAKLDKLAHYNVTLSTLDQSDFDRLIAEIKALHFKIALLNLISMDVV
jgi:hypothetical protein